MEVSASHYDAIAEKLQPMLADNVGVAQVFVPAGFAGA